MIGFFPELYPDELLFSICSRYHARAGYRSREATGRDLFGSARVIVAIALPCNIDSLIAMLPLGHRHTADEFIDKHTLLPFYGPFVPAQRLLTLREDMRGRGGGAVYGRIGILISSISVEFLRFCPLCVEADREKFDETYWHRLHQVPGVEVCPLHNVFLENSHVPVRDRGKHEAFVTAERSVFSVAIRSVSEANPEHRACLQIASDAAWLLEQHKLAEVPGAHRERYIGLLYERGLSTYSGIVKTSQVVEALNAYYTPEFLGQFRCGLNRRYNWIHRLVHNTGRAQHPLQHLLFIQFLGCTAARFLRLPPERLPFGKGPWPCLNRASEHFGQGLITGYELKPTSHDRGPCGIFRCECGFTYYCIGPARSEGACLEPDGYVTFGSVWENALRRLYKEGSHTLKEIAARLGVPSGIVRSQIQRLGLDSLWGGDSAISVSSTPENKRVIDPELLKRNRALMLEAMQKDPDAGRTQLRKQSTAVYDWLRKNDREWFEANLPARQTPKGPPGHVDWPKRDAELAEAIVNEAEEMRNAPGRPVRASATGIAKRLGKLGVITKYGEKLPMTTSAFSEVAEGVEEYALRRVRWAAGCYQQEGVCPSLGQLQMRAAVSSKIAKVPAVKAAMEAAILSIKKSRTLLS